MDRQGNNFQLRIQARDEAYKRMYFDIYRHKMRYDPVAHKDELGLDDSDIKQIQTYYKQTEQSELPIKFVTISLPDTLADPENKKLKRCLKKCYVGQHAWAFELGETNSHPHYHVWFKSEVKWLAKSRIISEWSKIFDVDKNYIHVESTSIPHTQTLDDYLKKEGIKYHSSKFEKTKK